MNLGIEGKIALVGASANGLGLATAQRLAEEGCHVALCDFDEPSLRKAEEDLNGSSSGDVKGWHVNFKDADSIGSLLTGVLDWRGHVDILVTNSGGPPPGTFDDATDEKWQAAFELTFLSAVRLIRGVLPGMKSNKWGRIINFTSRTLREPIDNLMISNAVRLAVAGMAKTLAPEVAPYGITVNNLGPGPTATARTLELAAARAAKKGITPEDELRQTEARIPVGHLADPEDQAAVAAFLASEAARHITGASLIVDGGETRAL
ncbi:MAG: SDR family oxidoreductase [Acidimicrobiia bacterium]|nr:SDR family oxidoreductase [Acidimicrobiia bacterium]MDH3463146.1 SDR family oxidoreductase [Acidimicrobiia bacterium]